MLFGLKSMQWIGPRSLTFGESCKTEGYLRLIDSFFLFFVFGVWLQIKIAYSLFKILFFLKYCASQNWGDILELNVDVNWNSFLFLRMSRDTLDLKLNVKWNLSNIDTGLKTMTLYSNFQAFLQHFTKETWHWPFCIEYENSMTSHYIEEVHAIKWCTKII